MIAALRQKRVGRAQLVRKLSAAAEQAVTVVCAPAGFGKSTLVAEWALTQTRPVAWLSLDPADNAPAHLLRYVIGALQAVDPTLVSGLAAALQTPEPEAVEAVGAALINALSGRAAPLTLVLDDWHVIDDGPTQAVLVRLIAHQPPTLRLVVITRDQPELPLARLRARGQLGEIGAEALRFNAGEADEFLREVMALPLAPAEVHALETRTEGWIAGLHLAALSLRDASDPADRVAAFNGSHRFVLDYPTEEVIARQTPAVRAFLLESGSLTRMSAALCDAVLGRDDSAALLEQVEAANLFLIPLDGVRRWYRFHHLFAEQLRARLQAAQPDRAAEVLRRASTWFAENGSLIEAIEHALESGDTAFAAAQLERHGMAVLGWGEAQLAGRWFARLPAEAWPGRPRLCLNRAWQLFLTRQYGTIERWLQIAEAGLGACPPAVAAGLRGEALTLRSFLTSNDPELALDLAQQAAALSPADNSLVQGLVHMARAVSLCALGEVDQALDAFETAIPLHWAAGNLVAALMATTDVMLLARARGQLNRAEALCQTWLTRALEAGLESLPAVGLVHQSLAAIFIERGQWAEATEHARHAQHLRVTGSREFFSDVVAARLAALRGDLPPLTDLLTEYGQLTQTPGGLSLQFVTWLVVVLLEAGQVDQAGEVLASAGPLAADPLTVLGFEAVAIRHQAQAALAQGSAPALRSVLSRSTALQARVERRQLQGLAAELYAARALIAFGLRDRDQARSELAQALALTEPDWRVQVFRGLGPGMALLIDQAVRDGLPENAFVRAVRSALPSAPVAKGASPDLPEPLSERELQVLGLMTEGLTYAAIARRLHLSLNTVRYHVKSLCGKLDVASRAAAIARGRNLRVL